MIWLGISLAGTLVGAVLRVQHLDGLGGYGSNIGWHWPWTPVIQFSFFGVIFCVLASA